MIVTTQILLKVGKTKDIFHYNANSKDFITDHYFHLDTNFVFRFLLLSFSVCYMRKIAFSYKITKLNIEKQKKNITLQKKV